MRFERAWLPLLVLIGAIAIGTAIGTHQTEERITTTTERVMQSCTFRAGQIIDAASDELAPSDRFAIASVWLTQASSCATDHLREFANLVIEVNHYGSDYPSEVLRRTRTIAYGYALSLGGSR